MPSTAEQLALPDAFKNIETGAKYLKRLFDKYKGILGLALAAYNAGPASVDAPNYVDAILKASRKKNDASEPSP